MTCRPFFLLLFTLIPSFLRGQTVLENNPPSLKWRQVNTPHFRVIFPEGFEVQGRRVANTLEHVYLPESKSLGSPPRRISIVLQNQSSESNGFVSVLPRRSEFYTMPSQDYNFTGTNDWLDLLAAHEYRHVVQYQHAMRGFNRFFYYVFGATAFAGMAQVAAPDWFWEGDAVATETAFSRSGRGRIPNFSLLFRTNVLEGRTFNYHKQYLGSFKHQIPDHYVLGYHMVSYLRKRTNDADVWERITARSWSVPFIPFAFSNAVRKETGMGVSKLYREMVKDLREQWQNGPTGEFRSSKFDMTPVERHGYTDYLYPHEFDEGVLVLKRGIGEIERFVVLNGGTERRIFTPGFMNDAGMVSASGTVVVWTEYGYDPRWTVRNYSLIKAYDTRTKKQIVIGSHRGRYGSAAISPDQRRIAAVHTGTDYQTRVEILSYPEGLKVGVFPNAENSFYSMPRWTDDGAAIVALKTDDRGRSVVLLDTALMQEVELVPPSAENVGYPVIEGQTLLFNSPVSGIDNIFAIDLSTGQRYQVTHSRYGAYNPRVSKDRRTLWYNDQGRDGMEVVSIPFDQQMWTPFTPGAEAAVEKEVAHLVEQEGTGNLFANVPESELPVTKFSKAKGLVNPYAWGFYVENDLTTANVSVTSQDLLSTTRVEAGYTFDIFERTSAWRGSVSYQGLFPILDIAGTISNRSVTETSNEENFTFGWREESLEAGVRIPLVTTSSRFFGSVSGGNSAGLTRVRDFANSLDDGGRTVNGYTFGQYIDNGTLVYNHFQADAYRLMKRSHRDINSKWGQRLLIDHFSTPYGGDFDGRLFAVTGLTYFPGLFRHHSLWAFGAFQDMKIERNDDSYWFRNRVPLPRGLSVSRYEQFMMLSGNYSLPLWYPDIAIGPVLNIQRLRLNAFFDYGFGGDNLVRYATDRYASTGAELKIDFNAFRFLPRLDVGVRYSHGIQPATARFEILIGTVNF